MRKKILYILILLLLFIGAVFSAEIARYLAPKLLSAESEHSLEDQILRYGNTARKRWEPYFKQANVEYPPKEFIFLGLKEEQRLEIYAPNHNGEAQWIRTIPICAASGLLGPKLREGDRQVPEGIYQISFLNPNSLYHLSLRINYPNYYDKTIAEKENRTNLGGDIMIHGKCVSIGCLAINDEPVEDLFILSADAGIQNSNIILAPFDFRKYNFRDRIGKSQPAWILELYSAIEQEMRKLPTPSTEA